MFRNILVIFEDEKIAKETLTYAREFALRVDAPVTLLMLIPMSFAGRTFLGSKRNTLKKTEERAGTLLADCGTTFIQLGIEVSSALRIGDPAQELIKFLADRPPFQAIIWGSGTDLPSKGQSAKRHWINKVAGNLECPLLTVSKKEG